ncbi:MAG: hypothetical protein IPK60_06875 [Sandaracinaceae bacterium]|nr:hypothetical protein [Sandaracinaceae bacterium]
MKVHLLIFASLFTICAAAEAQIPPEPEPVFVSESEPVSVPVSESEAASEAASVSVSESESEPVAVPSPVAVPEALAMPSVVWTPDLEIFARYNLNLTNTDADTAWFHSFDLTRAHVGLRADYSFVHARLLLEGAYSTEQGSLFGVAGDSFVARFREAWVGFDLDSRAFELHAGMVRTLTIPSLESASRLRVIERMALEQAGFASPADLGVTATWQFPYKFGFAAMGMYSGEGYMQRELNRGKNVEAAVEVHPLAFSEALRPLAILASYVHGSTGTASLRANRLTTALLWSGERLRGGAMFTYAWGNGDDGAIEGSTLDLFVRAEPVKNWLVGARFSRTLRNLDVGDDRLTHVMLTTGLRIAEPLEVFAALSRTIPGAAASLAMPGSDSWDISLIVRTALGGTTP